MSMDKVIRWYNTNRKAIWKVIGIAIVIIIAIQVWIHLWRENKYKEQADQVTQNSSTTVGGNLNTIALSEDKSVVTGEAISSGQTGLLELIDTFITHCNNGKVNEAYELISNDCKKEMYPTVAYFKANYYDKVFKGKSKSVTTENWIKNIYKVKFADDALASGVYNESSIIQDYITVIQDEDGSQKLNINSYIGKQNINIEKEMININTKIIEKRQYMDFEKYVFEITNKTSNTILLNDADYLDQMYLQDKNGLKYNAYTNEITEAELTLRPGETRKVAIKYHNKYSSTREIRSIVFSRIILNYTAYASYQNPGLYGDYGTIQIDI